MKPAFPLRVPGNGQALHPAAGELYQVLLQGFDTEGILDLEVVQLPICALRMDEILAVLFKKARRDTEVSEGGIVKISQDGLIRSDLHRLFMVGSQPFLILLFVAVSAGSVLNELDLVNRIARGTLLIILFTGPTGR